MTWTMPHEGEEHERTWMAWPTGGYTLGDTAEEADEARRTWSAVANTLVEFEPVTVLVDPAEAAEAARWLDPRVETTPAPLNDAWARDIGPTFVVDRSGETPRLGAVDWVFNGWGAQEWAAWDKDEKVAELVAGLSGAEHLPSPLVNEGGGIHVDGEGTVLVTETVQLDPHRNPGATKESVEAELRRTLGVSTVLWLPCGLTRDSEEFGTRGHVDIVATFARPGVVLYHDQRDPQHPDHEVSRRIRQTLEQAVDARGRRLELVPVPAPAVLRDEEGWVDYSYLNHLVANGVVVACSFDDPHDAEAARVLAEAYPGRQVRTVDARPLFARGGGIHCITQQQPRL